MIEGMEYPFEVNSSGKTVTGSASVVFVAPVVDPASGLLRVKLAFENQEGEVRPGVPAILSPTPRP